MSVSSEVQRTLVKSPPELWAELSDPVTLARHLGELGEIRIVRSDPERAVEWEAAAADGAQTSGRVELAPSGWGTKVTLSASRRVAEPEPEVGEPEPEASEPDPEIVELEPELVITEAPEPRPGFFARLFRRRRNEQPPSKPELMVEPEPELAVAPEPVTPEAVEIDEPAPEEVAPEMDISAELTELEEQTTAVLTGVLDRLGAAHHRPFSRA